MSERATQGRGGVVRVDGETVTSAFHRIGDAIAAAVGAQQAIAAWSAAHDIEPPIELAMGVNIGPVTAFNGEERLEYFGRTVDVAAQLAAEARAGDVVLLSRVFEEASGSLPPDLISLAAGSGPMSEFAVDGPRRVGGLANEHLVRLSTRRAAALHNVAPDSEPAS